MRKEEITDADELFDSMKKCRKSVGWKPSVISFCLNGVEKTMKMEMDIKNGKWKNGKPRPITITYPKRREGLSIQFTDRVYQRSLNDNSVYPETTRSFIYDNCACQRGKGTSFARKRIKQFIKHFAAKGGYVLHIDIKGYYPNMRHDKVKEMFAKRLKPDIYKMVADVLDTQYSGSVGYNPGSQMVQIAGIALLDRLDHFIKEKCRARYYIRYMDDIYVLHEDEKVLNHILSEAEVLLTDLGFETNKKKTMISKLSDGFMFLGFNYRVTATGKIVTTLDPKNIKHERQKLARMAQKAKQGFISRAKVDECYHSWKSHASYGNSYNLLKRMDEYYKNLWRDSENGETEQKNNGNQR